MVACTVCVPCRKDAAGRPCDKKAGWRTGSSVGGYWQPESAPPHLSLADKIPRPKAALGARVGGTTVRIAQDVASQQLDPSPLTLPYLSDGLNRIRSVPVQNTTKHRGITKPINTTQNRAFSTAELPFHRHSGKRFIPCNHGALEALTTFCRFFIEDDASTVQSR